MLETYFRNRYQTICIEPLFKYKTLTRLHPNLLTFGACLAGIAVFPLLTFELSFSALLFLMISGFLDTLDGSIARHSQLSSNRGAALDIVCDRLVEFAVIFGLFAVNPITRALPTILMLGSVLICVTSFLVVGIFTDNISEKSFFYSPGLMERAEAFVFFAAMILFPSAFAFLAYLFSFLVLTTAFIRMVQFLRTTQS